MQAARAKEIIEDTEKVCEIIRNVKSLRYGIVHIL